MPEYRKVGGKGSQAVIGSARVILKGPWRLDVKEEPKFAGLPCKVILPAGLELLTSNITCHNTHYSIASLLP